MLLAISPIEHISRLDHLSPIGMWIPIAELLSLKAFSPIDVGRPDWSLPIWIPIRAARSGPDWVGPIWMTDWTLFPIGPFSRLVMPSRVAHMISTQMPSGRNPDSPIDGTPRLPRFGGTFKKNSWPDCYQVPIRMGSVHRLAPFSDGFDWYTDWPLFLMVPITCGQSGPDSSIPIVARS